MRLRFVLLALAGLLVVVLAVVGFALSRMDLREQADAVEAKVKEATGRELKIAGPIGFRLSLFPTLSVENVRYRNAAWGSRPDMLLVRRAEIRIALLPLLTGNVVIRRLVLIEPDVLLEIDAKGNKNWDVSRERPQPAGGGGGATAPIQIRELGIANGKLALRSVRPARSWNATIEKLALETASRYEGVSIDGAGSINGIALSLRGEIDNLNRLGAPGATGALDLDLAATGIKIRANGRVPLAAESLEGMDVKLDVAVEDGSVPAALTFGALPRLPAFAARANVRTTDSALEVEDFEAKLGASRLSGRIQVGLQGDQRPVIVQLHSPILDLKDFGRGPGKEPRAGGRLFPDSPLPVAALKAMEGRAVLRADKLKLADGGQVEGIDAQLTFSGGRISAERLRIRLGEGELALALAADARSGKTLAIDASLQGGRIPLGTLAGLFGVSTAIEGGSTEISLRLHGSGESVRALAGSASGELRLVVGPARLRNRYMNLGADLTEIANALNPARAVDEITELRCAVLRFPVRNGVAHIENGLGIETTKVVAIGGGTINLRNETIDLGIRPKATTGLGIGAGKLAHLARIRGSLTNPEVGIDMEEATTTALVAGAAYATGGLSLLVGSLLIDNVPDHPCRIAQGTRGQSTRTAPKDAAEGLIDSLKKLFGP
jgi:uncharacterized protein involved in outer membrane biogenesis